LVIYTFILKKLVLMVTYLDPIQPVQSWMIARIWRHFRELTRLAAPIVVSRAGILVMATADTAMVGRFDTKELAYMSIGGALIIPIMLVSMGMTMGTLILTSNSFGAKEFKDCGVIWRHSLPFALMLGLVAVGIAYFGPNWLALAGQTERLANEGGAIMRITGFGLPGYLLFMVSAFFLEGIRRPLPSMFVMIAANLLNFILNFWFISGGLGLDANGAVGAAWATVLARWFLGGSVLIYICLMTDYKLFGIRDKISFNWRSWSLQRRLGYASGLSVGVEAASFASLNIFAGWMGEQSVAAYCIGINVLSIMFMIALGFGVASSVRVGIAYGRKDYPDAALAGWIGLGANSIVLVIIGGSVSAFAYNVASMYSTDLALVEYATPLVFMCGLAIVFDGGQAVMANVLRGRQDVWIPSGLQTISYIGFLIPLGWVFSIHFDHGPVGLFEGIFLTSILALSMLMIRFCLLCRRDYKKNHLN
jgi:MATE family multidrug resistance protein